jgi:ABC-type lipoprotein release transport system permease subunit/ABC-type Zn uptake system ZnuABC Zn-binding protein ZnuA
LYIAFRYLLAKKSHNAINIVSLIAVCSVTVATIALVCVLSVFNGFRDLITEMSSNFDAELRITPAQGKVFDPQEVKSRVCSVSGVLLCREVLEDGVLVRYSGRQELAVARGVEADFEQVTPIDGLLLSGSSTLSEGDTSYGLLGVGLASSLGVNAGFVTPLELYAPRRTDRINMSNPISSFRLEYAFAGGVFCVNQPVYDESYIILPLELVRSLLSYDVEVTSLELKLTPEARLEHVQRELRELLGADFVVKNRYEQEASSYKMMQIEKWMTFLILSFVLIISLFNVISSISMLMIEKQGDVRMLRSMGSSEVLIRRIFLYAGSLIPLLGSVVGVLIGVALCLLQQHIGFIKMGTSGMFISDAYPVVVEITDILIILATVSIIGVIASWYPVHYLGRKWLSASRVTMAVSLLSLLTFSSCESPALENRIAVTIEPQRYFAERIVGDHFSIYVLVPSGHSPETYDPSPSQLIPLSRSRAYLHLADLGFERAWLPALRSNNPHLPFFDLSIGIPRLSDTEVNGNDEDKDDKNDTETASHAHHHYSADPHIWSTPRTARLIARNTLNAILSLDSANRNIYQSNYENLLAEIDTTNRILHSILDTLSSRAFVIYHPALTYFADEYNLTQLAIESSGKEPSPMSLSRLTARARELGVRVVFVQREFDTRHAEQLASEIGARLISIDPLSANWRDQLIFIAKSLAAE